MNAHHPSLSAARLSELLAAPGAVVGDDLQGLRAWRDRFPYAASIGVLVAKAAAEAGALDQQAELLRAAAGLAARDALFHVFVRPRLVQEAIEFAQEVDQIPEPAPTPLHLVVPPEPEPLPAEESEPPHVPAGIERETLLAAIESSIEQDVRSWHQERVHESPAASAPADRAVQGRSSYARWLAARAQRTGFGNAEVGSVPAAPTQEPKGQAALIDAFIAASPRIGKLREVGGEVEDLARQSVLEDASLVTETMARVYAKQGQIGKARKAYKLLALKYPAKSTYFAAQLKQLGKSSPSGEA